MQLCSYPDIPCNSQWTKNTLSLKKLKYTNLYNSNQGWTLSQTNEKRITTSLNKPHHLITLAALGSHCNPSILTVLNRLISTYSPYRFV